MGTLYILHIFFCKLLEKRLILKEKITIKYEKKERNLNWTLLNKRSLSKKFIVCDSNNMTLRKSQNYGDDKNSSGWHGFGGWWEG